MLRWATIFFVIPLLVALAGLGDWVASAANVSIVLFVLSLSAFVATFFLKAPPDEEDGYGREWSS